MDVMQSSRFWILISLVFLAATTLAIYNATKILTLHMPIAGTTTAFSVLLPAVETMCSLWFSFSGFSRQTLVLNASLVFSLFESALIALAIYQSELGPLDCAIDRSWRHWFQIKEGKPVRSIQNALNCCGLRSTHDKAWPFPRGDHGIDACAANYNRDTSCYTGWIKENRKALIILIITSFVSLTVKVSVSIVVQVRKGQVHNLSAYWSMPRENRNQRRTYAAIEDGDRGGDERLYTEEPEEPEYTDDTPRPSNVNQSE